MCTNFPALNYTHKQCALKCNNRFWANNGGAMPQPTARGAQQFSAATMIPYVPIYICKPSFLQKI